MCGYITERTGGHLACSCVHPLNDNSVGASNSKTLIKFQSFQSPFRWCFEYRTFLQKMLSMTKIRRFLRGFSVVNFSAVGFLDLLKTLKTQRHAFYG